MGMMGNIFGAAVLGGALAGPGIYYNLTQNEYVVAKVTGRVQADVEKRYAGYSYYVYTDNTPKLDTFSISYGRELQENVCYSFNLKGARIQPWPLSYSRSIVDARRVACP